ncbi:helix-turn-helix domain-containing protein [Prevotella falsenii]|uniref:helix-turn-helix domain-containing protein n=1 Tax=Prevotella falsenii TaxID=515414 RepID=UPI00046AD0DC|nr:helix-turn-helix domain-containing protein [Prevotella falsenii]
MKRLIYDFTSTLPDFLRTIICALYIFIAGFSVTFADVNPTTVRAKMLQLPKGKRLLYLRNICDDAIGKDDKHQYELLKIYIVEAQKQASISNELYALKRLMSYYYNYDKDKELYQEVPVAMNKMIAHGYTDYYYELWSLLIERYFYTQKITQALSEAKELFADAKKRKNGYGLAVANNLLGEIYAGMYDGVISLRHFSIALEYAKKLKHNNRLLILIYSNYTDALYNERLYSQMLKVAQEWEEKLNDYAETATKEGNSLLLLTPWYAYCNLSIADAQMQLGNYDEANNYLQKVASTINSQTIRVKSAYYHSIAQFWMCKKDYEKALKYSDICLKISASINDAMGMNSLLINHANILNSAGRYKEASQLYSSLMEKRDSLEEEYMRNQLNEMSVNYQLENERANRNQANANLVISLGALLVSILLGVVYYIYTRKLRQRERIMFKTVQRFKLTERLNLASLETLSEEKLTMEERLFIETCQMMDRDKPYRDPDFNRETMAALLNTNRTYLGSAIRKYADGLTISEFITRYRLRYAAALLVGRPDMNINDTGLMAGFNSRSTYNRLFRNFFGVSPTSFRDVRIQSTDEERTEIDDI